MRSSFGVFFIDLLVFIGICCSSGVCVCLFLSSHLLAYGYLPVFRKNKVCSGHKSYTADRFGPVCLPCHLTAALTWLLVCLPPQDYILRFLSPRRGEFGEESREASGYLALSCCSLPLLLRVGQSHGQL